MKDYGGSLQLWKKWAESFLLRRGYIKRKKAARKLPIDFPELKLAYLKRTQEEVKSNATRLQLLFNWDQTGVKLLPVSSWTPPVVGVEDKREITVLLAATAVGTLLPPQVI